MATIYIVEDDMNICEIEQFALKNAGYETKGFGTAAAFEQQLKEKLPDLIILDVMLPDKDGLEILKGLRMNKSTYKIPVIMITAKSTELDKVKGLDLGADDYMTKPFGVMELISRVKAMMRRLDLFEHEDRLAFEGIEMEVKTLLDTIHDNMYAVAEKNLEDNTFDLKTLDEVKEMAAGRGGFARTKWCGSLDCELKMKEAAGVSSRCMPLKQSGTTGKCVCCGKECTTDIYWGVAY